MSRTWTPFELHRADLLCDFSKTTIRYTDSRKPDEKITLYDCNAGFSKKYPNLSFLFSNCETEINDITNETLSLIESELANCIKYHDENVSHMTDTNDISVIIEKWYLGEMAPIGDNNLNDTRFKEFIKQIDRKVV